MKGGRELVIEGKKREQVTIEWREHVYRVREDNQVSG